MNVEPRATHDKWNALTAETITLLTMMTKDTNTNVYCIKETINMAYKMNDVINHARSVFRYLSRW
jgi:hypothetical protein